MRSPYMGLLTASIVLLLTSCRTGAVATVDNLPTPVSVDSVGSVDSLAAVENEDTFLPVVMKTSTKVGRTYHQLDGNRLVNGHGKLPEIEPLDIALAGTPVWLVATATVSSTVWAVTLADGTVQAFDVATGLGNGSANGSGNDMVREISVIPNQIPIGMPPLLYLADEMPLLLLPDDEASQTSHAVFINDDRDIGRDIAFIDDGGALVIRLGTQTTTLAVDALLDARILVDETGRLLFLSGPTERYGHGVLGDRIEASSITLVKTAPSPELINTIVIPESDVIEGLAPIWVDLNSDGQREIIVTHANANVGAWIAVYSESGELLATGPDIGRGSRWRHQLAVAPFGPTGEMELVDVLTPHIGGRVEFYQWQENQLTIVAHHAGYTSHVIGTRNLDMAVAGDFDGDNQTELLLPNQERTALGGIRHTSDGATVVWSVPVGGVVVTNLAAVSLAGDNIAVGAGRSDGVLRIWQQ